MRALEKDRNRRYETAGAFAADVRHYLCDEPVQACPPSAGYLLRKFVRRNRGRLLVSAVGAAVLVVVGGGVWWSEHRRAVLVGEHENEKNQQLIEERARRSARHEDIGRNLEETVEHLKKEQWADARLSAERAETRLVADDPEELHRRLKQARTDLAMSDRLEAIRLNQSAVNTATGKYDHAGADSVYRDAFRDYGIDVEALEVDEAVRRIGASAIRAQLIAALDDWIRAKALARLSNRERLAAVLRRADRDPLRDRVREVVFGGNNAALMDLARNKNVATLPPTSVILLAGGIDLIGERTLAAEVLRQAQRHHPDDFWINNNLAFYLAHKSPPQPEEALGFYRTTVALRPGSSSAHMSLAEVYRYLDRLPEALGELQAAIELQRDNPLAHYNRGLVLMDLGRFAEAEAPFREALRLRPDYFLASFHLGLTLQEQKKFAAAETIFRGTQRMKPDRELRRRLGEPDCDLHRCLGEVLSAQRKFPEAVEEFRAAINLEPANVRIHNELGTTYFDMQKLQAAEAEFRCAIRLVDARARALSALCGGTAGVVFAEHSKDAALHSNLANALSEQRMYVEAVREYQVAIRLNSTYAKAYYGLALTFQRQGQIPQAEAEYRRAVVAKPDYWEALENLAGLLQAQGKFAEAADFYQRAVDVKGGLQLETAAVWASLAQALHRQGKFPEAEAAYRKAVAAKPGYLEALVNLGDVLFMQRKYAEATVFYQRAVDVKPDDPLVQCGLGRVLMQQGKFEAALVAYRRGHELGSRNRDWKFPSEHWVRSAERMVALDARLVAVREGRARPADTVERLQLAGLCRQPYRRLYGTATQLYVEVFAADAAVADNLDAQTRYAAAGAAVLAGTAQGEDAGEFKDEDRTRWRKLAREWLEADLRAYTVVVTRNKAPALSEVNRRLQRWREDPDLAGMRDAAALNHLPVPEREAATKMWATVDDLLKKTALPKE
jgi:tetratricopeptide (TPR) repeat protein